MKESIFLPKLQQHHQVSGSNKSSHFFCPYYPFENLAIFGPDPLLQPARLEVDEDFIGAEIEILYSYEEPDGSTTKMWCQGEVVAVRTKNRVHIEWDASTLREGDEPITEETLLKSKYNNHVILGWRFSKE
jgi:hypothetical protein